MNCNLQNRPNIKARNSHFDGVKDGCWLYRWLQIHSFILIIKRLFRPLKTEDLLNLRKEFWPQTLYITFGRIKNIRPHFSTAKIIIEMIRTDMTIACILAFIQAGLGFSGPIIIKYILEYLNDPNSLPQAQNNAYGLAGFWMGFFVTLIYVKEYFHRLAILCATKVDVIIQTQLYRKTMKVSSTYSKYIQLGDYYTYWFIDTGVITSCVMSFPDIVGAPTTLALSVIFVCIEVGPYGLLLLGVICVAIMIELIIDINMTTIFAHKLTKYDLKLAQNTHMLCNMKQLKTLCWQRMFVEQNINLRVSENVLNRMYYILGQIYLFVTTFAPMLVIFMLLLVGIHEDKQQWSITVIFTVIGYIGVIITPLRNLPNVIGKILISRQVFRRIENFLGADQSIRVEDIYMEEGTVEIKNLIMNVATRSSMNRLITRESIFLEKQDSMLSHVQTLPIEVRLFHTLDFMNEEQTKKFIRYMKCIDVPFDIKLKRGDNVIVLSQKSGSGKTSFVRAFLGTLSTESGYLKYGGRIGFVSGNDFYLTKSIRDNVLFGEPYNAQKLKQAYQISGLDVTLQKFKYGDLAIMDGISCVISPSQKVMIAFARAIYYKFDILLMDDAFHEFQLDQIKEFYHRICTHFSDKLVILTTNNPSFIRPQDKVMLLEHHKVIQYSTLAELKSNPNSAIHRFETTDLKLIHYKKRMIADPNGVSTSSSPQILSQSIASQTPLRQKRKRSLRDEDAYNKLLTPSSYQYLTQQASLVEPPLQKTHYPLHRPSRLYTKYYWLLFRNGGLTYLITFLIIAAASALQTFSTWLIGSILKFPLGLGEGDVLLLYACLQILFAGLLLVYGVCMPSVAILNTQRVQDTFNSTIASIKMEEFQKFSKVHLIYNYRGDNQNFYYICDCITTIFHSFVALVSTMVIMGLASYYIWIVAGVVSLYSVGVYFAYRLTYQEVYYLGKPPKKYFFRAIEDSVRGAETFQFYDKTQWFKMKTFDGIYIFSTVWKTNMKFIGHAFNILIGFAQLGLMAGILFLAIFKKSKFTAEETVYVSVAVSASPAILGNIFALLNNLADLGSHVNSTIKTPTETLVNKGQSNYDTPAKPSNWPWNGHILFRDVYVERKQTKVPLIDNLTFSIESGEVVGMYGDYDNDIDVLFQLINGMMTPEKNDGTYAGKVLISGMDISTFGQIYTTEAVLLLSSSPVCFNGTVRYNVDPFNKYPDQEIEWALKQVRFWDELETDNQNNLKLRNNFGTLDFMIEQRGSQLATHTTQKLNLARALIKKPKILLLERSLSKLEMHKSQEFFSLIRTVFADCTIIYKTMNLHYLLRCDRVFYFKQGKIEEHGRPDNLASNPKTRLYKMIKCLTGTDQEPMYQ